MCLCCTSRCTPPSSPCRLRRERLEFSPVFAAPMQFDGHTFGYVRLVNFSSKAAEEMKKSIAQLQVGTLWGCVVWVASVRGLGVRQCAPGASSPGRRAFGGLAKG